MTEYKEFPVEDLQDIAEAFLRVLSEASVEEADIVLKNYAFERVTYRRKGKERARKRRTKEDEGAQGRKEIDF